MLLSQLLLQFLIIALIDTAIIPQLTSRRLTPGSRFDSTTGITYDPLISTHAVNGGVFPPEYPKSQYQYHVRFSTITLKCVFRYKPRIKQYQVDAVIRKSIAYYGDPEKQNDLVYQGAARAWDVHNQKENEGVTYLTIRVNTRNPREMTYGHAVHALIGVNRIRTQWPKLDMGCRIYNTVKDRDIDLGDIELFYDPTANPYIATTE
ncbi:MAG: hypothetical protein Q9213_006915 [Squamulea squamosa]